MYTRKENQNWLNNSKSGPKDIAENQVNTFHVEHKTQADKEIQDFKPLKYNMKKFEALTQNRKEFLFAPNREQAGKMFFQTYGHHAIINEVEKTINE